MYGRMLFSPKKSDTWCLRKVGKWLPFDRNASERWQNNLGLVTCGAMPTYLTVPGARSRYHSAGGNWPNLDIMPNLILYELVDLAAASLRISVAPKLHTN